MYQAIRTPYTCCNAVLLLFFNRFDTTKRVFTQIAKVKPPRIYLAGDGSRHTDDKAKIERIRAFLLGHISWDCEIHTRFLESNLGCKLAISSAISWFFSHEKQGIILEDDCLPNVSFFRFCDELLERYKHNEQVMMISGWSALDFAPHTQVEHLCAKASLKEDYYFSKYNHIWGWASWARAWSRYQLTFKDFKNEFKILNNFSSKNEKTLWYNTFKAYAQGKIDTWDYPWTYSIWKHKGLCIYPKQNMILNIGLNRADATHTNTESKFSSMPAYELIFPLKHPSKVEQNYRLDSIDFKAVFQNRPLWAKLWAKIRAKLCIIFHTNAHAL